MNNLTVPLPTPAPVKRTAWRAVRAALAATPVPLSRAELSRLTDRGFSAVSMALSTHPDHLIRTGPPRRYRYTLKLT